MKYVMHWLVRLATELPSSTSISAERDEKTYPTIFSLDIPDGKRHPSVEGGKVGAWHFLFSVEVQAMPSEQKRWQSCVDDICGSLVWIRLSAACRRWLEKSWSVWTVTTWYDDVAEARQGSLEYLVVWMVWVDSWMVRFHPKSKAYHG